MDQINDYIINFLLRKESPEDRHQLKQWLDADPAHRDELKKLVSAWDLAHHATEAGNYHPDTAFRKFMERIEDKTQTPPKQHNKRHIRQAIQKIAAIFIVSFTMGILAHRYVSKETPEESAYIESIVPLGSQAELILPDSSRVWLNSGSKLRYPIDYGKENRNIYLEGEGYFKVAARPDKPFTVHTALMKVTALGTEFNVKDYSEENMAETMLVSGSIMVDKGDMEWKAQPVKLDPGQKMSVRAIPHTKVAKETMDSDTMTTQNTPMLTISKLAPEVLDAEVSWKGKNWRIESEELQSLAIKLERRFNVKIMIDDRLKTYRFTGTLKDQSLTQVLQAMRFSAPILFTVEGENVTIQVDKNKLKTSTF